MTSVKGKELASMSHSVPDDVGGCLLKGQTRNLYLKTKKKKPQLFRLAVMSQLCVTMSQPVVEGP